MEIIHTEQAPAAIGPYSQGYIMGGGELFWLGGTLFLFLIILVWQARPPFGPSGVSEGRKK